MIKVKISKSNKFDVPSDPTSFDISLKNEKEELKGELIIDSVKKIMRVNLGRALTDYTKRGVEHEQLALLKEIFYCFCITECKKGKKSIEEHIEEYTFIDENKPEERKTIIDCLMCYSIKEFNEYKRKEKIIYNIKSTYDKIKKESKYKKLIELDLLINFSNNEIYVYKKILLKYLSSKGINGKIYNISNKYNEEFKMEFPFCYPLNPIYAYKFLIY